MARFPTDPPRRRRIPLVAIAFGLSIALHGLLLLIRFQLPEQRPVADRGLEVVLVNTRHAKAPDKAEVLAQANVDAGGQTERESKPSTPLPPQPARREGEALVDMQRRAQPPQPPQQRT